MDLATALEGGLTGTIRSGEDAEPAGQIADHRMLCARSQTAHRDKTQRHDCLTLTVDQVAERLENRIAPLTGGTAPRLLWNRLSVFAGGFGLDTAERVGAKVSVARQDAFDLVNRLVARSVVLINERKGQPCCWRPSASTALRSARRAVWNSTSGCFTATSTASSPSGSPRTGTALARKRAWS
ncbi:MULTISPECIES: hypothetical protein [unclassified Streptomyces]|uniref:hypothetical protein n=1 Tax=unclassified Streptomyces TaxID=2593676 RepID=UPI002E20CD30